MRFSPSQGGFWPEDVPYANLPGDLVEVDDAAWATLLAEHSASGRPIVAGPGGQPILGAAPPVDLKAYAAAKRYAAETGGITVGGAIIRTDRDSQAMVNGAFNMASDNPALSFDFKAAGGWVTIPAAEAVAIGRAVGTHVQACFSAERALEAAIDAGSVTTPEAVDAWAWPPNEALSG